MRNPAGGIMAAPLAIAAPETGGWRDRDVIPAPVAYSLQIIDDAIDVTQIRVDRSTVAQGKRLGFSRSEVVDASQPSRVIAITMGIGVSLGDAHPASAPLTYPPASLMPWICLPCTSCSGQGGTLTAGGFLL